MSKGNTVNLPFVSRFKERQCIHNPLFYSNWIVIDRFYFSNINGTWIAKSDYNLDDRPHFEVLGEKYINADSEEEIWIPIKKKQ